MDEKKTNKREPRVTRNRPRYGTKPRERDDVFAAAVVTSKRFYYYLPIFILFFFSARWLAYRMRP